MPNTLSLRPLPNPLVVAVAYDQLCTFEFGIATEIFALSRPEMGRNWYRFAVAGVDQGKMRAAGGLTFSVDGGLDLLAEAGTIIIPGWRGTDAPVPQALIDGLAAAHARGARILSFCSGAFVLAAAGLLEGLRATTHWRYTDALMSQHPEISVSADVLYVDARRHGGRARPLPSSDTPGFRVGSGQPRGPPPGPASPSGWWPGAVHQAGSAAAP
jgi:AraC family transcriptional regulator, transcriptional activator FtrA